MIWKISILLLVPSSCNIYSKFLETVSRTPVTIGITATFFSSLASYRYISSFTSSLTFNLWSSGIINHRKFFSCWLKQFPLLLLGFFSHQSSMIAFHLSLIDRKSPQVSRTLLSIPTDLNNAVVWIVSTHLLISKSSSPCTNILVTRPSVPIIIGIIVTFMLHGFFSVLNQVLGL